MTTNRLTGMLTGTFVTCAVQSSSATTVMTVSFVSAGLLTLAQAISVIMGANIGTTLTAWIMSLGYNLNLSVVVFPAFLVGMVLIYKKRHRYAGEFLFGLAFLFWSLVMLSGAGKAMDLQHNAQVVSFFSSFDTSSYLTIFIFLIAGTLITCIVQSSAAVMAITILLCSTGVLPIYMGIALVMGENIAHLLFNMFGVVWVLIVFYPFVDLVCSIVGYNPATGSQTALLPVVLAMFHTCFNVLNTALLIGFIPQMERIVCRLLPDRQLTKPNATLHFIDGGVMATPEISVMQAQKEIIHFAERMQRMFGMTRTLTDEKNKKEFERQYERIERYETIADNMEIEIATYLEQVSNDHLSDATKDKIRMMFRQIGELESIGDACFKMARTIKNLRENREDFTPGQYARLRDMQHLVNEALTQMMVVLNGRRENLTIDASRDIETDINTMRDSIKAQTLSDVNSHAYSYTLGTIYTDIVTDCEKLGDYVMNVVEARLGKRYQNYNGLKMNVDRRTVTIDGQPISLTRTEFDLLYQLLAHRNHVLSRQQLTVNVHVTRLRKKLGLYAQNIVSRQGLGYVFEG